VSDIQLLGVAVPLNSQPDGVPAFDAAETAIIHPSDLSPMTSFLGGSPARGHAKGASS
jgi:hypothetical protein